MNNSFFLNKKLTRVVCSMDNSIKPPGRIIDMQMSPDIICGENKDLHFETENGVLFRQLEWELTPKDIYRYDKEGAKVVTKKTVDGEKSFVEKAPAIKIATAYEATIRFGITPEEKIYGMGQHEAGRPDYRNTKEYLYQNNMKIPMPVFLSTKNYALLFDANCLMVYEEKENVITLTFDAVEQLDYYIITGADFDELVRGIRRLTGQAVMLPKWSFGYIQSRERYKTQQEIIDTANKFMELGIPVSCIVQDWLYWENKKWGNKLVDKARFPSLIEMISYLHTNNIAFMVSVWPNAAVGCEDNKEMQDAGVLLSNLSTYDAFNEEARGIYWKQCERELFAAGADAWWCDSTEPFTPDWNGEHKKSEAERYALAKESLAMYLDARDANAYALVHAQGIYEHQTKACISAEQRFSQRVFNLTRSGWPSIQKYGAVLWSGDIKATWEDYKSQIAEGLNMCASGIPYWTLDIGAFFVGNERAWKKWSNSSSGHPPWFWQGDFEDGVNDKGYCELYTRWLQFGTFLPIMRSHGTDTPREPWEFGIGSKYYETITKYIKLRYKLLPYIYSLSAMVSRNGYTIMRRLAFDFAGDSKALEIRDQYMFGAAFLVCPVVQPIEYGPGDVVLNAEAVREVYLPSGCEWYDYDSGILYSGGQTIKACAPIEKMPLFVRAGSIIPVSGGMDGAPDSVEIFEGADGSFELYLDNGTDYSHKDGNYALIRMYWSDSEKALTVMDSEGDYAYPESFTVKLHTKSGGVIHAELPYHGVMSKIKPYSTRNDE